MRVWTFDFILPHLSKFDEESPLVVTVRVAHAFVQGCRTGPNVLRRFFKIGRPQGLVLLLFNRGTYSLVAQASPHGCRAILFAVENNNEYDLGL